MIKLKITTDSGQPMTIENVKSFIVEATDDGYIDNVAKKASSFETVRTAIRSTEGETNVPVKNNN